MQLKAPSKKDLTPKACIRWGRSIHLIRSVGTCEQKARWQLWIWKTIAWCWKDLVECTLPGKGGTRLYDHKLERWSVWATRKWWDWWEDQKGSFTGYKSPAQIHAFQKQQATPTCGWWGKMEYLIDLKKFFRCQINQIQNHMPHDKY